MCARPRVEPSEDRCLEAGQKAIGVEELMLLPSILSDVRGAPVAMSEIVESDERFNLNESVAATRADMSRVFADVPADLDHAARDSIRADVRLAERKAARRLGVEPRVVVEIARELWGRSLARERDRIVSERADAGGDPARLRALRGQVTRKLVGQLAGEIEKRKTEGKGNGEHPETRGR